MVTHLFFYREILTMQEEYILKHNILQKTLKEKKIDAFVAINDETSNWQAIAHQTGFCGTCGLYFLPAERKADIFFDKRYLERAKREIATCNVQSFEDNFAETICKTAKAYGLKTIACQADETSAANWITLENTLQKEGIILKPFDDEYQEICSVKTKGEIARIKAAAELATEAFMKTLEAVKDGITEATFAAQLEYEMAIRGATPAFGTIVASGEHGSIPHAGVTKKEIQRGEIVTVDFGARLDNYVCDITRNFVIGKATEEQKSLHNLIKQAHITAANALREGASGQAIHNLACDTLGEKSKYFTHGLGHGIGLYIHESPRLSYRKDYTLKSGQIVTVEPGLYFEGKFGMRLEDDYLITEDGAERLTSSMPQELFEI